MRRLDKLDCSYLRYMTAQSLLRLDPLQALSPWLVQRLVAQQRNNR